MQGLTPWLLFLCAAFTARATTLPPAEVAAQCRRGYVGVVHHRARFYEALATLPGLREKVFQLMDDPELPPHLKRIFTKAIQEGDVELIELTQEIRKAWNVPEKTGAFARKRSLPYELFAPAEAEPSTNQHNTNMIVMPDTDRPYQVVNPDRPLTETENDLSLLVHELAHVRFELFFRRNLETFLERWPKELIYKDKDGVVHVDGFVKDLIEERYTHEKELDLQIAAGGRHMPALYTRYPQSLKTLPRDQANAVIGRHVLYDYKLYTPVTRALATAPLGELLDGSSPRLKALKPVLEIIDRAPRVYDADDFDLAFALASRALAREGKLKGAYGYRDADLALRVALQDREGQRAKNVVGELLSVCERHQGLKQELMLWLDREPIRKLIAEKTGWEVPPGPLTAGKILRSFPETKPVFEKDPLHFEKAEDRLALGWIDAVDGTEWKPPKDPENLYEVTESAAHLKSLRWFVQNRAEKAYNIPLKNVPAADAPDDYHNPLLDLHRLRKKGPAALLEIFKRLGLEDAFHREFPDPESFWKSDSTLLETLKKLGAQGSP